MEYVDQAIALVWASKNRRIATVAISAVLLSFALFVSLFDHRSPIDRRVVWKPSDPTQLSQLHCGGSKNPGKECLVDYMKGHGASSQAVAFSRDVRDWLSTAKLVRYGYAEQVSQFGPISMVKVIFPLENQGIENEDFLLINSQQEIIDPDASPFVGIDSVLSPNNQPLFAPLLRSHPSATVWPVPAFDYEKRTKTGGERIVFKYPVLNGCHACARVATAKFAFEFDSEGAFIRATVAAVVSKKRPGTSDAAESSPTARAEAAHVAARERKSAMNAAAARPTALGTYQYNISGACTPGTRFDGYGTQYTILVPDSSLQRLGSDAYVRTLLNKTMIGVIRYCNSRQGNHPVDKSSRFFASIDTQSHLGAYGVGVRSASKELGQSAWTLGQSSLAFALKQQRERIAQAQAQNRAQQRARQDEASDRQYASQHRARLNAAAPSMPTSLYDLSQATACKIAMADLVNQSPPLQTYNYCPYGHSRHFSHCTSYLSNVSQGWARLSIPYTYHGCYGETVRGAAEYKFKHFDQGWKMSR